MAHVAMFHEVDEGTAIFKVTNDARQGMHVTYDDPFAFWNNSSPHGGSIKNDSRGAQVHQGTPIKPRR